MTRPKQTRKMRHSNCRTRWRKGTRSTISTKEKSRCRRGSHTYRRQKERAHRKNHLKYSYPRRQRRSRIMQTINPRKRNCSPSPKKITRPSPKTQISIKCINLCPMRNRRKELSPSKVTSANQSQLTCRNSNRRELTSWNSYRTTLATWTIVRRANPGNRTQARERMRSP